MNDNQKNLLDFRILILVFIVGGLLNWFLHSYFGVPPIGYGDLMLPLGLTRGFLWVNNPNWRTEFLELVASLL